MNFAVPCLPHPACFAVRLSFKTAGFYSGNDVWMPQWHLVLTPVSKVTMSCPGSTSFCRSVLSLIQRIYLSSVTRSRGKRILRQSFYASRYFLNWNICDSVLTRLKLVMIHQDNELAGLFDGLFGFCLSFWDIIFCQGYLVVPCFILKFHYGKECFIYIFISL